MPLTKHLYNEDEVIAALKWSILRRRFPEVVFWTQECIDSNMLKEFIQAVTWCWMFGCAPKAIGWIQRLRATLQDGHTVKDTSCIDLALSLTYHMKNRPDSSVLGLLGMGLEISIHAPDHIGAFKLSQDLADTPLIRALAQGKTVLAWHLLHDEWSTDGWTRLREVCASKHSNLTDILHHLENAPVWMGDTWNPNWTWCFRAIATITMCLPSGVLVLDELSPPSLTLTAERLQWLHLPQRYRRIYQPPTDCLYWFCKRGNLTVNQTNEHELMAGLEQAFIGSKYWDLLRPELCSTDSAREEFYNLHFPNDIPDEWSTSARAMSHGTGVIPVGAAINHATLFNRFLDRWFLSIPSTSLWRATEHGLNVLKTRWLTTPRPSTLEKGIHDAYTENELCSHLKKQWDLVPKRREFVL